MAVMFNHWLPPASNFNNEPIDIAFKDKFPYGSVTFREYTRPPMITIFPSGMSVAVWSTRGGGGLGISG